MKVLYLGQAGLLVKCGDRLIMIDPYLSDSLSKVNGALSRRVGIDESFLQLNPDILLITHAHQDHYDPATLAHYLTANSGITVMCPQSVWGDIRKYGGNNRYIRMSKGTCVTQYDVRIRAIMADHSDEYGIGFCIDDGKHILYHTGDTLFNKYIFEDLDLTPDIIALPVNGEGNNMNPADARRFAERTGARNVILLHIGLLDDKRVEPWADNVIVPRIYEEIIEL